ncbi:MAG TPA: condensation domain-containing protein [Chthoniobacterales bacterium]
MSGDKRTRLKQWLESGEARLHPLTLPQRELWEASAVPLGDPGNHICCLIPARGLLTKRDCETAFRRVVERQEVLRLSFLPGKEQPLQMVRKSCDPNLEFRELSSAQSRSEAVEEIAGEIFCEPFDLIQGPLYRAIILRRTADDHVFVFAIHHAIADGWTLGVFVQDLFGAYLQEVLGRSGQLPPVPLSYTEWGAAERAFWQPAELERRAPFWKSELAGSRRLWAQPSTHATLRRWVTCIPADIAAGTRDLARRNGVTLFSTLLAAFQITLSRWTGMEDIVVGTPVANRGKQTVRETMGYFSGIVPLRARVDGKIPFLESLNATHQTTVDCFANAMPFAELVRAIGESPAPGYHPVFQVRFALQNHPVPHVALPTLSAKLQMRSTGTARFDLGCEITEQDETLEVVWLFRPTMFSQSDVQDLDRNFRHVLASICHSPESTVATHLNSTP